MKTQTNGAQIRAPKPKMTAEDAVTFDKLSGASIQQISDAIDFRRLTGKHQSCDCRPYADVFTFARWQALGYFVNKGEQAIRFVSYVASQKDKDTERSEAEETPQRLYPRTLCVFCRCQVTEKGAIR